MATKKGPDRADKLKPITDAAKFQARLLDSILNTTQPPVDGVRIEVIPSGSGAGYVKCLVPPSHRPPHRAMLAEHQYWRRTSNSHRRMEHYELEDVFGRRLRPVLRLGIKFRPIAGTQLEEIAFTFLNEGRGLARHAGMMCIFNEGNVAGAYGHINNASDVNDGRQVVTYYSPHDVIHPNGLFSSLGTARVERVNKDHPLKLSIKWYAENMAPRDKQVEIAPNASLLIP